MERLVREGNIEFDKIDSNPYKYFSKREAKLLMPLLRHINYDLGLRTVSACCGHSKRPPYVNIEIDNSLLEELLDDRYKKHISYGTRVGTGEKVKDILYLGDLTIIYSPNKEWAIFWGVKSSLENGAIWKEQLDFYTFEYELINILSKIDMTIKED